MSAGLEWLSQHLPVLRCPHTQQPLHVSEDGQFLINESGTHRYPIVDGIPHLLPEAAQAIGAP